jgi:hypothetical protein
MPLATAVANGIRTNTLTQIELQALESELPGRPTNPDSNVKIAAPEKEVRSPLLRLG